MTDLAVIIVSWNVRDMTLAALRTLYVDLEGSGLDARVILLDNASEDGTVEAVRAQFPQTEVIDSAENLGFVRGNNLVMRRLGLDGSKAQDELPKATYLLNPDTLTQPGATRALYDVLFSQPDIGMTGARMTYGDGSFQHSAFVFPGLTQIWAEFFPTPGRFVEGGFNGRYPKTLYQGSEPFDVDYMLGATMMLRSSVIYEVGLFDEAFFMYCDDVDWGWRIRSAGYRILCVPQAHVVHLGGASSSQAAPRSQRYLWESRLTLFQKHLPAWKYALALRLIRAGMRRKIDQIPQMDVPNDQRAAYRQSYEAIIQQAQQAQQAQA
jgi:N-acetylglucosaminyl-diphospho-decaprenol L-rhamnosyltransferase